MSNNTPSMDKVVHEIFEKRIRERHDIFADKINELEQVFGLTHELIAGGLEISLESLGLIYNHGPSHLTVAEYEMIAVRFAVLIEFMSINN